MHARLILSPLRICISYCEPSLPDLQQVGEVWLDAIRSSNGSEEIDVNLLLTSRVQTWFRGNAQRKLAEPADRSSDMRDGSKLWQSSRAQGLSG